MSTESTRVITRQQQGVKVIKDLETINRLFDKNLEPIVVILRDTPLTIKELVKEYNQLVEEPKSEMTIYRYVKELAKYDIVAEVGKIVTIGQSATETLYGRTAKIFWNLTLREDYWTTDQSWSADSGTKKIIESLRDLLSLYTKNNNISTENLETLLSKMSNRSNKELAAFFEENNEEIDKIISRYSFKDVDKIFDILSNIILIMNSNDFREELEKCGC